MGQHAVTREGRVFTVSLHVKMEAAGCWWELGFNEMRAAGS